MALNDQRIDGAASRTPRSRRLDRVRDILEAEWGPEGSRESLFRRVERGQIHPVRDMYPSVVVADGGERNANRETDDSYELRHTIDIVIYVAENWDRYEEQRDWEDTLDRMRKRLLGDRYKDCATRHARFVDTDRGDLLFSGGETNAVLTLTIELHCFATRTLYDDDGAIVSRHDTY